MVNERYEYTVTKHPEGSYLFKRAGMVCFYVLCASAFFLACYLTRLIPVFALCPLLLWILIFFTWRYVNIEYKYTVESGMLRLYTVYGTRTLRENASFHIKDALGFIPLDKSADKLTVFGAEKVYDMRSSSVSPKNPYALLIIKDGIRTAALIEAPAPSVKAVLYYAQDSVRRGEILQSS